MVSGQALFSYDRGVRIGGFEAHAQERFGQDIAHRLQTQSDLRWFTVFEARTGKTVGGDQHEFLDSFRVGCGKVPGQSSADGVADETEFLNTEVVQ